MARQFYGVPQWVVMYVSSLFCGYSARKCYIEDHHEDTRRIEHYRELNGIIDHALDAATEPGERDVIFKSIKNMTGYNNVYGFPGGARRFYAVKEQVLREVAERLRAI